jgi:endonuclease/exonuclease/phosphatase family metal-dependent hydrolase
VIGLQEARHDFRFERSRGQGEQLAADTGYVVTEALAQVYVPFLRVDEGLVILSRERPIDTVVARLGRLTDERQDENRRICLGARLRQDDAEVDFYTTHFSLGPRARLNNAAEVIAFIEQHSAGRPAILTGDLNALPESPEILLLREHFTDVWATSSRETGLTYPAHGPVRRIDYIFASNVQSVHSVALVGSDAENGVYPSDHLGIVADLDL